MNNKLENELENNKRKIIELIKGNELYEKEIYNMIMTHIFILIQRNNLLFVVIIVLLIKQDLFI